MPDKNYRLIVKRHLENGGNTIRLVGTYYDLKDSSKPPIETICYFEKQGPSPNPPPASVFTDSPDSSAVATNATASVATKKPNFSGTWNRVKTLNFDSFIGKI